MAKEANMSAYDKAVRDLDLTDTLRGRSNGNGSPSEVAMTTIRTLLNSGLAGTDIARIVGTSKTSVYAWKSGSTTPGEKYTGHLHDLKRALGILIIERRVDPVDAVKLLAQDTHTDGPFAGSSPFEQITVNPEAVFEHLKTTVPEID